MMFHNTEKTETRHGNAPQILFAARTTTPKSLKEVLRSEIPSSMCAKLRTVAVSNNRDHARNLSYYCLLALHI